MKNLITTFAFALTLSSTIAFANNNNEVKEAAKTALPATTPALETPAPQNGKTVNEYNKYTPAQKASIVELKLAK
ncbi:hypothetical protein [Dyadobacter sp.]|uniref:hypothetical protein n=1 Tax=Dyadobacter sp. TaxID=1914288 RepID=UPI003F6F30A3